MLKYLLLLNFITFSFQMDNCWETDKICKSCKSGYTLIALDDYNAWCEKTESLYLGEANDPCLVYSEPTKKYCLYCKKGYLMDYDDNNKCKALPENCVKLKNGKCVECRHYFKLTEDNKCEKTSCYEYKDGVCECYDGFYLVEKKECKKIPIKYCALWDGKTCTECYEGTKKEGNECKLPEGYDEEEDDEDEEKINIEHCSNLDSSDKTKCGVCYYNYELNDDHTKCISLCTTTEEVCGECKENYYAFDGKTCSIIDPDYKDSSKLTKFNLVVLSLLLFFIF